MDFGVFGAERDAYFASDDIDKSYAGLGFFGLGIRKNYDNNLFLTGNIVPFHTGGTYPVDDLTSRFDIGVSKRTDKATNMLRLGIEKVILLLKLWFQVAVMVKTNKTHIK